MLLNSSLDTLTGLSIAGAWNGLGTLLKAVSGDFTEWALIMKPFVTFAEGAVRLLKLLP